MRRRPVLAGALLLFGLLAAVYSFSVGIRATRAASITGDEPFYLLTTQSLLRDRDLDLTNQYAVRSFVSFFDHPLNLWRQSVSTADGRLLSPHDPGLSVYLIPGFAWGGLRGAQWQMLLTAALLFALTYALAAQVTARPLLSWLATLAVAVAATPFIYATEVYPEVPAALALVVALLLLTNARRPGAPLAAALALLLGVMVWLGVKYAPLALLVGAAALLRADHWGRAVFLGLALLIAVTNVWFHLAVFGGLTPYTVNLIYANQPTAEIVSNHVAFSQRYYRLWGLFIDERFGVGRWAPLLLLVPVGLVAALRGGLIPRLIVALFLCQLLIATFVNITIMGWWFPGRTLMVVLPLTVIPLVSLLAQAGLPLRALAIILALYSAAVTAALAWAGHAQEIVIAVDPFDMAAPFFRDLKPLFPDYRSWPLQTWVATAAWLALGLAACGPGLLALWREVNAGVRRATASKPTAAGGRSVAASD